MISIKYLSAFLKKKIVITLFGIVIFLGGILYSLYNGYIWFVYPDRDKYQILGIDVSHHQGLIDWESVKNDGIKFAYIKSTEGDDWMDIRFEENYIGAKKHNIPVGAYHFYSLRIPPEEQLKNIINTLSGKSFDLPIVIDLEFGGNSRVRPLREVFQKDLQILLDGVESFQGVKPILYITYEFQEAYLQNKYDSYPVWIRDILSHPDKGNWIIWQYKNRGHVRGITGFVDLNVLSGSIEDIIK